MSGAVGHSTHRAEGFPNWAWFGAWGAVGAAVSLGLVSLGPLTLVPASVLAAVMLSRDDGRHRVFGVLAGAGAVLLVVAWINRAGPATTCWHTASASGCDQHLDPIPWLVVGLVLLLAGIIGSMRRHG